MGRITITGAGDGMIQVDGDISEVFSYFPNDDDDDERVLAFSDGTLLRLAYDVDGICRLTPICRGTAEMSKVDGVVDEDMNDVVTLVGEISWVVSGEEHAKRGVGK